MADEEPLSGGWWNSVILAAREEIEPVLVDIAETYWRDRHLPGQVPIDMNLLHGLPLPDMGELLARMIETPATSKDGVHLTMKVLDDAMKETR